MEAEEKTSLLDKDFRAFFMKSPVGRMVVAVGPGERFAFTEVNTSAAASFDLAREDMLGRTPRELFGDAAEQMEQAFRSCARNARTVSFSAVPRMAGGVRMQAFILNPIVDGEGRVHYIDVTARAGMLDSVQLQRERDDAIVLMTSIFDASGLGIVVADHHGRLVRVNDAFLKGYGWSRDELLGEDFTRILPPARRHAARRLYDFFIARGRHGMREMQVMRRDGTLADVLVTTALMELSQKRRFMVASVKDVTERNNMIRNLARAKEEADSANRAKSSFLANMSHELRTPLNAIIGFTELMQNRTFGRIENPKYEEYLGDIHFSARHLLDIINDVLDMSKIEAGRVDLVESEVSVPEALESVLRLLSDRAGAAYVNLEARVEDGLPHIKADQRLLRQILINLVANSVKFTPPGKTVRVHALPHDGGLRITVEDEGCGIPADMMGHVMQPFGQVRESRQAEGQGTGLGLPLAKAMTELHGGRISLESEENRGTRVHLDFPADRTLPPRGA